MKKGQVVSQQDLLKEGWSQVDFFGDCEIWSNNSETLLWNPQTKKIVITYDKGGV